MSLIADALNKAQQQQQAARSAVVYPPRRFRPARPVAHRSSSRIVGVALGVLALGGFTAAGFVFRSHRWLPAEAVASLLLPTAPAAENSTAPLAPPPPPVSPLPSLGRAGLAATSSPFTAPSASAPFPQVATPTRDYELAGVTSLGQDTLLSISRRRDHRSLWIAVGKSAAEISVLSYQPDTDHAIIRVDDRVLQIAMHDAFVDSPAPSATE